MTTSIATDKFGPIYSFFQSSVVEFVQVFCQYRNWRVFGGLGVDTHHNVPVHVSLRKPPKEPFQHVSSAPAPIRALLKRNSAEDYPSQLPRPPDVGILDAQRLRAMRSRAAGQLEELSLMRYRHRIDRKPTYKKWCSFQHYPELFHWASHTPSSRTFPTRTTFISPLT
jgi:hypothetical protein